MTTFVAEMGRILAIDWGTRRTGIAVTDPMRIIASPLETVATHELNGWLKQYFAAQSVDIVVVGRPSQMDGRPSETMAHIEPFFERLRAANPDKQIVWHDERFTSKLAQRAILDGGVPRMARRDKALVDRVSATIILQSYMESIQYKNL